MNRSKYFETARDLYDKGEISGDVYDAMIMNADAFCDEEEEEDEYGLPSWYAEIEYDDLNSKEAVDGMRFDDMNFMRYMER